MQGSRQSDLITLSHALENVTGQSVAHTQGAVNVASKLIDLGVTSLSLYRFVLELERLFNLEFKPEHLVADNFISLDSVLQLVQQYRQAGSRGVVSSMAAVREVREN